MNITDVNSRRETSNRKDVRNSRDQPTAVIASAGTPTVKIPRFLYDTISVSPTAIGLSEVLCGQSSPIVEVRYSDSCYLVRSLSEYLQELYTVYLARFRTYKIALPPQTKIQEGRGPQTDKHLPPNPFTGQFLREDDLRGLVSLQVFGPCWQAMSGSAPITCHSTGVAGGQQETAVTVQGTRLFDKPSTTRELERPPEGRLPCGKYKLCMV